jgi:hypothetical protein
MIYIMLVLALALSAVAAFYSIAGLVAIFAASPVAIAILGSILEGSKLVIASWLYRNWNRSPALIKHYFIIAVAVLMLLTSMGIFGYLSKAHLEHGAPTAEIAAKVAAIDDKIAIEKGNIDAARRAIDQLDRQVDQTISRTTDAAGTDRSVAIRRSQSHERAALAKQIDNAQAAIGELNEQRAPLASELRKTEVEVGPIKYIAALVYGDSAATDTTILEKAVRSVMVLIVAVFDPLAVIMLIAVNWSLTNRVVQQSTTDNRSGADVVAQIDQQQLTAVQTDVTVDQLQQSDTAGVVAQIDQQQLTANQTAVTVSKRLQQQSNVVVPNPTIRPYNVTWRLRP